MSKQFRSCDLNQALLLPPSLQDWLPEDHLARFVAEIVETLARIIHVFDFFRRREKPPVLQTCYPCRFEATREAFA